MKNTKNPPILNIENQSLRVLKLESSKKLKSKNQKKTNIKTNVPYVSHNQKTSRTV